MVKYVSPFLLLLFFFIKETKAQILAPKFGGVAKYFKGTGYMFYRAYLDPSTTHVLSATEFDTRFKSNIGSSMALGIKKITGINSSTKNSKNVLNWDNESDFNTINGSYTFADKFIYKAEGIFIPKFTGNYTFNIEGDDAVDLFIGTTNVTNHYDGHGPGTVGTHINSIALTAGQFYLFRIRLHELGGGAAVKVFWRKPNETTGWYQDPEEIACISSINESSRWSASSVYQNNTTFNATLSYPTTGSGSYFYTPWLDSPQAWTANSNSGSEWLKYDLGSSQWVLGIVTQGREDYSQWVTNAKIEYSENNSDWSTALTNATLNSDKSTKKIIEFNKPVFARYIKVTPSGYQDYTSLRFGVIY
jgi:hypothetical protein